MCGISGIINKNFTRVSEDEIRKMTDLIVHRGPDSEGYFIENNFAFGNRRLCILDLSENGHQPMTFKTRYTITYNGEIYNYLEIRKDLERFGYMFNSGTDTEVILAAYDKYGTNCINRFNGMWAFALYDKEQSLIFCSRDRFGVKPFYYSNNHDKFVFGSELKQIIGYQTRLKVNQPILMDYLVSGFDDHTNETFYRDIYKLEQAHNLIYNLKSNTWFINKYYEINIDPDISKLKETDSINLYKSTLYDSIKLRLRSDVKVGTCLSGGLDSSSVATIASSLYRQNSNNRFTSITAKSTETEFDESHFAEAVSKHSDLDWNITTPATHDFITNIDKIISVQEEPFGSPSVFMQFMVFQKARELGCTVMLDGQGGDESLLGYERYYPAYLLSLSPVKRFFNFFNASGNSGLSNKDLLFYLFYFTTPSLRLMKLKKKFPFINKEFYNLLNVKYIQESSKSYRDIINLQMLELMNLQLPHLLKYEDRNSMYHSIETRLPFIDYRLIEIALSLDNGYKIKDGWTKYVLRKSVEDILPFDISWRKNKIGFNAPEKTWMTGISDQVKNSLGGSEILSKITDNEDMLKRYEHIDFRTRWRLFNIAKWEEVFNVSID